MDWKKLPFALLLAALPAVAQDAAFFETQVAPILRKNCQGCHMEKSLNGGLSLTSKESILAGGNRGPAAVPGNSAKSLLLEAVRQTGELKMPKGKKLADEEVAILAKWVDAGMPVTEAFQRAKRRESKHWAFQPLVRPTLPAAFADKHPVDAFVLAKLAEKQLAPSPRADQRTLLRRLYLDLTGIPPTLDEMDSFLADRSPNAYEKVVDRLLASPHYGERWGRHWLDLARYSDTDGYTIDAPRDIYPYRDWVLQALNKDMPFDQFVVEQVAGDLLPNPTREQLIATGFHRNTPSNYEGGIDFEQYRVEAVADRVATTGAAFLGLTLGCARCHDHKYDPISQREFYQLFAFFNNTEEIDKEADRKYFNRPFLEIGTPQEIEALRQWDRDVQDKELEIRKHQESLTEAGGMDEKLRTLRRELTDLRRRKPQVLRTMIIKDLPQPRQTYIHLGGDFTRKGANVMPNTPSVFPPIQASGPVPTRLDFARWLVSKDNPLTARVTVNRIWQHYFGKGIVESENDLGVMGDRPSHQELLNWLAAEFMGSNWSMKALHRMIVTSATYQQSSQARPDAAAVDPENKLLARQNRLRLDAEVLRDAALLSSGLLSPAVGGPSVFPPIPPGAMSVTQVLREWKTATGPDRYRRGLYTYSQRSAGHPSLLTFDGPDGSVSCTRRIRSNTPLQSLSLLNDEANMEFAEALAKRMLAKERPEERINYGFQLALQRPAKAEEQARLLRFLQETEGNWTAVARVLLNLDAFMTRE